MSASDDIQIRPAAEADQGAQAALFDRCFDRSDGGEVLPWRYGRSTHGEPVLQVAAAAQGSAGELVASYACNPRVVSSRTAGTFTVGQTGDVMTAPEARGKGVFSSLDKAAMGAAKERGWPFVFGLPNRASAHIFTRDLGWEHVGDLRPWTFVLVADRGAREERMRAGRAASAAVPWTAWRGTMARGKLRKSFFGKINVVPLPRFGDDADAIAEQVAAGEDWFVRRRGEDLNWRFFDAPSGRFRAHGVFEPSGELAGWCVVQLPERGEFVGYIAEVVAVSDVAFAGAMEAGLGHLRKAGASVARAHAVVGSTWEKRLMTSGFRAPKKDDTRPIILRTLDESHPAGAIARAPERWFFADSDRDAEIIGG